jgi:acetyl esterase
MGREPDYLAFMRRVAAAQPPSRGLSIAAIRRRHADALAQVPRPHVAHVRDLTVDGPAGPLRARLYRPAANGSGKDAGPALVYFHGGGWVMGDVEAYDPVVRALTAAAQVAFVSVDYRRPPEDPYPAAVDDGAAAVRWVAAHAPALGVDPARIGVGGDSAGGQIAAATALRLRGSFPLALQLLVYPALDLRGVPPMPPDPDGLRFSEGGTERVLELYLGDTDRTLPEVSPLLAPALEGLPPAVIATAEYDRLRPQGEAYARRLADAGVRADLYGGDGLDHGYLGWGSFARRPAEAIRDIGALVRAALPA